MRVLMESYAKTKNVKSNELIFEFDGDMLTGMESPQLLELEGGECIDVYETV